MSTNPRALPGSAHNERRPAAVGLLCQCRACQVLPPKPEPLYPRHSHGYVDELSDDTDAAMEWLRVRADELEEAHRATIRELVVRTRERDEIQKFADLQGERIRDLDRRHDLLILRVAELEGPPPDNVMTLKPAPALFGTTAGRNLLGAILSDPACVGFAVVALHVADFCEEHGLIFAAMATLAAQGTEIDHLSLSEKLKEAGVLASVGGPQYLMSLDHVLPIPGDIWGPINEVRKHRTERGGN